MFTEGRVAVRRGLELAKTDEEKGDLLLLDLPLRLFELIDGLLR